MKRTIIFRDGTNEFEQLKRQLSAMGIDLYLSAGNWAAEVDTDVFYKTKTRLAGRKLKPIKKDGFIADVSVEEIEQRMAKETADEIAASLGISRSTLFRRLKFAREFGVKDI